MMHLWMRIVSSKLRLHKNLAYHPRILGENRRLVLVVALLASCGCSSTKPYANQLTAPIPEQTAIPNVEVAPFSSSVDDILIEAQRLIQKQDFESAERQCQAALDRAQARGDETGIGMSLGCLAAANAWTNKRRAFDYFTAALPYFERSGDYDRQVATLFWVADYYYNENRFQEALDAVDKSIRVLEILEIDISILNQMKVIDTRAIVLNLKAIILRDLGRYEEAVEVSMSAGSDFEKLNIPDRAARAFFFAGTTLSGKLSDWATAKEAYLKAIDFYEECGDSHGALRARLQLSFSQSQLGESEDVLQTLPIVLEKAEEQGISDIVYFAASLLGLVCDQNGRTEDALAYYERALRACDGENWAFSGALAEVYINKGSIYRKRSEYSLAIESFYAAILYSQKSNTPEYEATALIRMAETYAWLGDNRSGLRYYKEARELYRRSGDKLGEAEVLALLGQGRWVFGSPLLTADEAIEYLTQATELLQSVRKSHDGNLDQFLGSTRERLGILPSESAALFRRQGEDGIPLDGWYEHLGGAVIGIIRNSKLISSEWNARYPDLGQKYLRAMGTSCCVVGLNFLLGNDLENSLPPLMYAEWYFTSMEYTRDVGGELAKTWFYIGEASRQLKLFPQALHYFFLAHTIANFVNTPEIHWILAQIARTYADMDDDTTALSFYADGLSLLENIRASQDVGSIRLGVMSSAYYSYASLVKLQLNLYRNTKDTTYARAAFECHEKQRARSFLDMIGRLGGMDSSGDLDSEIETYEVLGRRIDKIHDKLVARDLIETDQEKFIRELEELRARQSELDRKMSVKKGSSLPDTFQQPVGIEDLQQVIPPDAVFLEYFTHAEGSVMWAVTHDRVEVYDLPGQEAQEILVQFIKTLGEPLLGKEEIRRHIELGIEVYQALVGRAEELLVGKARLIIAPEGILNYLPFEALILSQKEGDKAKQDLAETDYLLKHFDISYVPSASIYVVQQERRGATNGSEMYPLLAFGDPVLDQTEFEEHPSDNAGPYIVTLRDSSLSPLPYSREEVLRIASVLGVDPASEHINLGGNATLSRLKQIKLSRYRILHFATHALLADEVAWATQPALVLSQTIKDQAPDLFNFSDILDLKLNADLVTLSACDTALGSLYYGEGIVGLTRAFMSAGASSVVVSLWKVEDQATCLLMDRFYRHLKEGEGKAEALRNAKLDIMHSRVLLEAVGQEQTLDAPFYWAAFVLVGSSD